ncbi:TRAP transporter small permease [Chloroflexota bacterium]
MAGFLAIERKIIGSILIWILVVVLWGICARYLPLPSAMVGFSEEVGRLGLVWFTFLSIHYLFELRGHYNLGLIVDLLKGKIKLAVGLFQNIIIIAMEIVLIIGSVMFGEATLGLETLNMQWPAIIFVIPLFIGSVGMCIGTIIRTTQMLRGQE